jgi:hypothetical protein
VSKRLAKKHTTELEMHKMASKTGLDLNQGRPLPAIGTTEAKLQQRKLDALNRGIHLIKDASDLPFSIHLVGVGAEGAQVVETFLREAPKDLLDAAGSRFTGLAVDIGDKALKLVRSAAGDFPKDKSQIETISLDEPAMEELQNSLARYPEFLNLEYPLNHENADAVAWLSPETPMRNDDGSIPRVVSKASYGRAYYDGDRSMFSALKRFAKSVDQTEGDSIVCVVFGLGDSTGSGIAMDLSRHLSSRMFGRRMLVTGIGIMPHREDLTPKRTSQLHAVFSELDVLCDDTKNKGVEVSCGDLYKNPFTAGFIVVPQPKSQGSKHAFELTKRRLMELFTERHGASLWESLRLLNWVGAPSTQHSAARTPWGARWIHLLGFGSDTDIPANHGLREDLGLMADYQPEFLELRTPQEANDVLADAWVDLLDESFSPEVPIKQVPGSKENTVQYLLPRLALTDLEAFFDARKAYDAEDAQCRKEHHALLLDQGLLLCEPSSVIEGMAGANIGTGEQWIAVPRHELRRDDIIGA